MDTKGKKKRESFYKKDTLYSFTLMPINKYQFFGSVNRLRRFKDFCNEQFLTFPAQYNLYIEVSEPRGMQIQAYDGPRLHFHGTILFKNDHLIKEYLMRYYYKLLRWTAVEIDVCNHPKIWHTYCTKQKFIKNNQMMNGYKVLFK